MTFSNGDTGQPQPRWDGNWKRCAPGRGFARWRPFELGLMIVGFMSWWPLGLAVIAFKMWQSRTGYQGDLFAFAGDKVDGLRSACSNWGGYGFAQTVGRGFSGAGFTPRSSGNAAFDAWRASEIARLEEERKKLEAAEREFADHITQLRRARDKEEFERFMRDREGRPAAGP